MKTESKFTGKILAVRAVEDTIRATHKYTEGVGTLRRHHPVQGEGFPSAVFCKFYEVYPELDLDEKTSLLDAVDRTLNWLWRDTPCIEVTFQYDYRADKAKIVVDNGQQAVRELARAIPGFAEALAVTVVTSGESVERATVTVCAPPVTEAKKIA